MAAPNRLLAALATTFVAGVLLVGCGGSDGGGKTMSGGATSTTAADGAETDRTVETQPGSGSSSIAVPTTPADAEGCRTAAEAQAETEAPEVELPSKPETAMVVTDDIPGCGELVEAGSSVTMHYVLKSLSSGKVVDSSWSHGEPFPVTLGQGAVIAGWDQGIPGMRIGGRRTLVLGPEYGYGPEGSPPDIAANDTLVFVVDALEMG